MGEFIWSLDDEKKAEKLEIAICGKGASSRFKDSIYNMGIEQQWYEYQTNVYKKIAIDWCRDNQVEYTE